MISRTIRLLLLFILAVSAGAYAQDENKSDRAESGDEEQTEQTRAGKEDIKPRETPADIAESFTPSEEISEDLSVSFPVDI